MLTEFAYVGVARVRDESIASGVVDFTMSHADHMPPWWLVGGNLYFYVQGYFVLVHLRGGQLDQCFSTAGPRLGTGPWHQLYRAARCSPGI